jgi:Tol biopolymer transport system component
MNDRRPSDARIAAALRAHLPAHAQAGLPGRVMDAVEITSQRRPLPSFLGALSDADPIGARRSLLIAAALLLALALAGAAAVGAWQLLRRETVPKLDLTPPADVAAFVLSTYDRMPQMPPVAITTLENGSVTGRMYVDRSGDLRIEHFATPDAPQPDTFKILSGTTMGQLAIVGSAKVWVVQDGAISEDPRVFLLAEMEGNAAGNQPGCMATRNEGEVGNGTAASGWTYVATEYVVGRPTFHVTCAGGDLWIDVATRLILRSRGSAGDGVVQPATTSSRTIEVTRIEFGEQPADLFAPPAGVARMSSDVYQCQLAPACSSLSPAQPAYTPPPRVIAGPLPPMAVARFQNGWIAVSANPWEYGGGENGDIYLLSEGAAPRRIIGSDGDGIAQACPVFSPDGQQLAYGEAQASGPMTTFRGGSQVDDRAIVVVGINDHGDPSPPIMRVALPPGPGEIACPVWSPDGKQVAFPAGYDLWVAEVASGKTTVFPVTAAPSGQQGLAWSHDGSRIAVAQPGGIRIVHVVGGASTLFPVEGAAPQSIGWSAGDDRIVYVSVVPVDGIGTAVHVMAVDGTSDIQLSSHGPAAPGLTFQFDDAVVSPEGTQVAYLQSSRQCTNDGSCGPGPKLTPIVVADLYDSNRVEIVAPVLPQGPDGSGFFVSGLQWSPDGKRLLLSSIDGVVSVAVAPRSPAIVYTSGEPNEGLNLEWSYSEVTWQPVGPAQSEAPAASESTGTGLVGFQPGTVGLTVGTHSAGFAGVSCQETGNGELSVSSGDPNEGEWFALVFRSDGTVSSLSGALRGVTWKVTQSPQGTLKADKLGTFLGTFSGKDAISGADVSGTFAC